MISAAHCKIAMESLMDARLMQLPVETAIVNMDKQGGIQLANGEIHISSVVCIYDFEGCFSSNCHGHGQESPFANW